MMPNIVNFPINSIIIETDYASYYIENHEYFKEIFPNYEYCIYQKNDEKSIKSKLFPNEQIIKYGDDIGITENFVWFYGLFDTNDILSIYSRIYKYKDLVDYPITNFIKNDNNIIAILYADNRKLDINTSNNELKLDAIILVSRNLDDFIHYKKDLKSQLGDDISYYIHQNAQLVGKKQKFQITRSVEFPVEILRIIDTGRNDFTWFYKKNKFVMKDCINLFDIYKEIRSRFNDLRDEITDIKVINFSDGFNVAIVEIEDRQ